MTPSPSHSRRVAFCALTSLDTIAAGFVGHQSQFAINQARFALCALDDVVLLDLDRQEHRDMSGLVPEPILATLARPFLSEWRKVRAS
jgi:hypothetical protein